MCKPHAETRFPTELLRTNEKDAGRRVRQAVVKDRSSPAAGVLDWTDRGRRDVRDGRRVRWLRIHGEPGSFASRILVVRFRPVALGSLSWRPSIAGPTPPSPCQYLTEHVCLFEYIRVSALTPDEYMAHLLAGWRRFGHTVFRQTCSGPGACRSLRVDVARFSPDRSQHRTRKANEGAVHLRIGSPALTREKVALFDRFHADRSETRGWATYDSGDLAEFAHSFLMNPFPTQEWCYHLDDVLVGIGYVDVLAGGTVGNLLRPRPDVHDRSLGTWNVLCLLDRARALGLPHVYLGYHAGGCPSLQYKARFRPNQGLDPDGVWRDGER